MRQQLPMFTSELPTETRRTIHRALTLLDNHLR